MLAKSGLTNTLLYKLKTQTKPLLTCPALVLLFLFAIQYSVVLLEQSEISNLRLYNYGDLNLMSIHSSLSNLTLKHKPALHKPHTCTEHML